MRRAHIRSSKVFSVAKQESVLIEKLRISKRVIYYDDLDSAIKSLRKGDELLVVGLRGLAGNRPEITDALKRIHKRDAAAVDAETERRSDGKHGAELMAEAIADLANERRGPPRKRSSKSAARRARRMPWDQIAIYWFDMRLTNDQVLEKVNDNPRYSTPIAYTTIWRKLKKRGKIPGRPSTKQKD